MSKKYIVMDLEDKKISSLASVLSNKTSRKIVEFLAEKEEASESEIALELKIPANTVNYNVKKLVDSGVIEKSKKFLWSEKGKKILFYKVANRSIVISPKKLFSFKKIIPMFIFVILGALVVRLIEMNFFTSQAGGELYREIQEDMVADSLVMSEPAVKGIEESIPIIENISISLLGTGFWLWFLIGGISVITFVILWDYYNFKK